MGIIGAIVLAALGILSAWRFGIETTHGQRFAYGFWAVPVLSIASFLVFSVTGAIIYIVCLAGLTMLSAITFERRK